MSRRFVITGGGTGIGRAIAQRIAEPDSEVVLIGRRVEKLRRAAEVLSRSGIWVRDYACDLSDPDAVAELCEWLRVGPRIDALILNAGGNRPQPSAGLRGTAQVWRDNFAGNVLTAVLLSEGILDHIKPSGGRIVAISSIAGSRGAGSYGAAKAALNSWVLWMSQRVAAQGITVNAVAPGFIPDTDFWTERLTQDPELRHRRLADIPLQRPGTPDEVAEAVAYLLADASGWTTGQIMGVNGGALLGR